MENIRTIEELKKEKERLQEENLRLHNEVKSLNAAIPKLRTSRDQSWLAEKDAQARANALEQGMNRTIF